MDAEKGEDRQKDHRRGDHLHHADAEIARPPLTPSALPCFALGKKLIFPMLEAKFAPAKPHSRHNNKYPERSSGILDRTLTKYKAQSG
jgi:uncharacterized protein involved in copper resistance